MCASVSFAHEALLCVCVYIYTHTHEKKVSLNLDQVPILNFYLNTCYIHIYFQDTLNSRGPV